MRRRAGAVLIVLMLVLVLSPPMSASMSAVRDGRDAPASSSPRADDDRIEQIPLPGISGIKEMVLDGVNEQLILLDGSSIHFLDLEANLLGSIPAGAAYDDLLLHAGSLFVTDLEADDLIEIDPVSRTVVSTLDLLLDADAGAVWSGDRFWFLRDGVLLASVTPGGLVEGYPVWGPGWEDLFGGPNGVLIATGGQGAVVDTSGEQPAIVEDVDLLWPVAVEFGASEIWVMKPQQTIQLDFDYQSVTENFEPLFPKDLDYVSGRGGLGAVIARNDLAVHRPGQSEASFEFETSFDLAPLVELAADGSRVFGISAGALVVFHLEPRVHAVEPTSVTFGGGATIAIEGDGLDEVTVRIGGVVAELAEASPSRVTVVPPPLPMGTYELTMDSEVWGPIDTDAAITIVGPVAHTLDPFLVEYGGGETVTITGTNLDLVEHLYLGGVEVVDFTVISQSAIEADLPVLPFGHHAVTFAGAFGETQPFVAGVSVRVPLPDPWGPFTVDYGSTATVYLQGKGMSFVESVNITEYGSDVALTTIADPDIVSPDRIEFEWPAGFPVGQYEFELVGPWFPVTEVAAPIVEALVPGALTGLTAIAEDGMIRATFDTPADTGLPLRIESRQAAPVAVAAGPDPTRSRAAGRTTVDFWCFENGESVRLSLRATHDEASGPWSAYGPSVTPTATPTFADVPVGHRFYDAVTFLEFYEVTTGYSDGTFGAGRSLTRQALAAWLYRLWGSPPVDGDPPFTDVDPDHPFADAITWLASAGGSSGFPDGTFRPDWLATRQGLAAFFYGLAGEPATSGSSPFSDVKPSHPFADAINWLASTGMTTGFADGTFRPAEAITRQASAAWFFRYFAGCTA